MAKQPSKKELYDAAEKMDKESWSPKKALGDLAASVAKKIMPKETAEPVPPTPPAGLPEEKTVSKKKGGLLKSPKNKSPSSRADGIAQRGKTKGRMV